MHLEAAPLVSCKKGVRVSILVSNWMHLEAAIIHLMRMMRFVSILVSNWMHLEDEAALIDQEKLAGFNPSF